MNIYIHKNEQQIGPYNETQIAEAVSSGHISMEDLAWKEGLTEWVRLGELMKIPPTRPPFPKIPPVEKNLGVDKAVQIHSSFNNAKASGADWASVVAGVATKNPDFHLFGLAHNADSVSASEVKNQNSHQTPKKDSVKNKQHTGKKGSNIFVEIFRGFLFLIVLIFLYNVILESSPDILNVENWLGSENYWDQMVERAEWDRLTNNFGSPEILEVNKLPGSNLLGFSYIRALRKNYEEDESKSQSQVSKVAYSLEVLDRNVQNLADYVNAMFLGQGAIYVDKMDSIEKLARDKAINLPKKQLLELIRNAYNYAFEELDGKNAEELYQISVADPDFNQHASKWRKRFLDYFIKN